MGLPRFCLGLPWVAWVQIGVGDRCLGVAWRSALSCGMEIVVDFGKMGKKFMGFVWV